MDTSNADIKAERAAKSWVGSRYLTYIEHGQSKRKCKHPSCGKEYSVTTSHMILKRHWSRDHQDIYSLSPKSRSMLGSTSPSNLLRRRKSLKGSNKKKTPSKVNSLGSHSERKSTSNLGSMPTPSKSSGTQGGIERIQFDVKQVSKRLKEAPSIHLSVDLHTPKKLGKTFGIITAHIISDSFELKTVMLEYRHLAYAEDPVVLSDFVKSCIQKFNCKDKIIGISTSESEIVSRAVQEIDKRQRFSKNYGFMMAHFKCFPYFVHSNVNDVLRTQDHLLETIRRVVNFINTHHINYTKPMSHANSTSDPSTESAKSKTAANQANTTTDVVAVQDSDATKGNLKLPSDGRFQWNTTYLMIETFLLQRDFIEPTLLYLQTQNEELADVHVDWDRLLLLVHLLKPFYQVINRFASENAAPISHVFGMMPQLIDHLSNTSWSYDDLAMAAHDFKMNLVNFRDSIQSDVTNLATVLDPRIKLTFVAEESKENMIDALRKRLADANLKNQAEADLPEQMRLSFPEMAGDEIDDYLRSPREYLNSKLYPYWECHKVTYPNLYSLARTIACIQATSVPGDRMFAAVDPTERDRKLQLDTTNSRELMRSWSKFLDD